MELGKPFADVFSRELCSIEFRRTYLHLNEGDRAKIQALPPDQLNTFMSLEAEERKHALSLPEDRRLQYLAISELAREVLSRGGEDEWTLLDTIGTANYSKYAALPEESRTTFRSLRGVDWRIYLSLVDEATRAAFAAAGSDEQKKWKAVGLADGKEWITYVSLIDEEPTAYLRLTPLQRTSFETASPRRRRKLLSATAIRPGDTQNADPDSSAEESTLRQKALEMHLAGMAISGGGIRTTTFGLGMLQGLARLKLLRQFDYLSTVSGGGYIHGWLAAWVKREGDIANIEKQLDSSRVCQAEAVRNIGGSLLTHETVFDEEPEPIFHLRSDSNYLTPRPGAFTADTWTLLTIYLRNLLINLLLLLPATMAVVVLSRFVAWFYTSSGQGAFALDLAGGYRLGPVLIPQHWLPNWAIWGILLAVSIVIALAFVVVELHAREAAMRLPEEEREPRFSAENPAGVPFLTPFRWGLLRWLVWPVVFYGGAFATWYLTQPASAGGTGPFLARWPTQQVSITGARIVRGLFVAALLVGLWRLGLERANLQKSRRGYTPQRTLGLGGMLVWIVWPLVLVSILAPWIFGTNPTAASQARSWEDIRHWPVWETWPGTLQIVVGFALPLGLLSLFFSINSVLLGYLGRRGLARLTFSGLAMGALAGLLLQMTLILVVWPLASRPYAIAWFAPTLVMLVLVASGYMEAAMSGDELSEYEREWRSRLGAFLFIHAIAWLAVGLATMYLPWGIEYFWDHVSGIAGWVLTTGWVGTIIGAAWTASRPAAKTEPRRRTSWQKLLIAVGPPLFLLGLLASVSLLLSLILETLVPPERSASFPERAVATPVPLLFCALVGLVLLVMVITRLINVNLFSLHAMYSNRLTRCYLAPHAPSRLARCMADGSWKPGISGAPTNAGPTDRRPNAVSGFDPKDDFPLHELSVISGSQFGRPNYWGPYPLFNTALNMISGAELAYQNRKADSFVITPDHCGSRGTGFATMRKPAAERVRPGARVRDSDLLTLGRVIAISGAAVDPNMGIYQSAATTALLTVFNLRLGAWIENPRSGPRWEGRQPAYGQLLISELLGKTDNQGEFVHLSDGGHFDNLGIYELVRRRCRYILAVDSAEDRGRTSDNLAGAIRLCRRDFGVRIEVNTWKLAEQGPSRLTLGHHAVGTIHYEDVDPGQQPGKLVYLKISMTGDESSDLLEYLAKHPEFPHHPTLPDQFFDETQFECYRALGEHIATNSLEAAMFEPRGLRRGNY